jgi:pimeloyl-ACP methyl ester carboxylesterase
MRVGATRVTTDSGVGLHVLGDNLDATGVPFLLVHGLASNARLWDGVRRTIAATGAPVAALDLRGHGLSDKPDDGYDFATVADDVRSVLDELGWSRAVVAGQSWGGNVVLELTTRHPDRVLSTTLVDGGWISLSRLGPWEVVRERLAPPHTTGTPLSDIEAYMRRAHPTWSDESIAGALACFEVRDDGTVAPWLSRDRHLAILYHLWAHEPAQLFPQVRTPVVLVPCDDGSPRVEGTRAAIAQAEQLLDRSRTVWFESSHDVHAEHPAAIAELLLEQAAAVEPG